VSWNQPSDPDLHVVPVLRGGANQRAQSLFDGFDLEYYAHRASTHAVSIVGGEPGDSITFGAPVTVSLFTVRVSTQVVSAPVVLSWTPRWVSTCATTSTSKLIKYGAGITVTGSIKAGSAAIRSKPATLIAKAANGRVTTLSRALTSSSGTLASYQKPTMNTTYTFAHTADFYAACSSSVTVVVASTLKAVLAATKIGRGRTTSLTVTVGPNEAGQYVTLQKLSGSRWVNVSTLKLGSTSKATWKVGSTRSGKITYQVKKAPDKYHGLGYSSRVVLTVI
jgi:hypothetical protein